MKLRRFIAQDTRSAMQQIKATLGSDAVILSSSQVEGGVEVVAAIDFDETVITTKTATAMAMPEAPPPKPPTSIENMVQEIQTLRGMLEAQLRGVVGREAPLHTVLMQKMVHLGMSYPLAAQFAQKVNPQLNQERAWQEVLDLVSKSLNIRDTRRIEEGGIHAFVGPTGVGKTTTLAKLAARFALRFGADNLGLVTMDNYRIAAPEQLMLYGKILGVHVCVAEDAVSLSRVLRQLKDKKLILIDTAGMSPRDTRLQSQMQILSDHLHSIATVAVLPATSHYQVVRDALKRYQDNGVEQCIITKVDESLAVGGILSAVIESNMAVGYLTHGQRVPEDIKLATNHQLVELLAEQNSLLCQSEACASTSSLQVRGESYA